ncbi:hypothetical protein [Hyalangium gracile]|uniref:hypothetical protein n=1 Tax=Hyalangium gracile TaxID=394092 RepID=UPI001CCE6584|nr:hypothetical protein [Hyalangium gracile]
MSRGHVGWWGALLIAGPALAQEPAAEVRSLREVQGPIKAVNAAGGTLTLEHSGGQVELRVDGTTTIFLPGRTGRLEDLRTGQRIRAAYEPRERGAAAQWIELMEP